jgi:hypothetical protein
MILLVNNKMRQRVLPHFIFKLLFVTSVNKTVTYGVKKLLGAFFVNTESETDLGIY